MNKGGDIFRILKVIDLMEVNQARVEKQRLVATYTIHQRGEKYSTDLIYRFGEPVFEADDPSSQNLADLLAVQVAINYGLFCNSIIFHGVLDAIDRTFILDMMRNTAREIYVKKFLQFNPFLTGDARKVPALKRDSYVQAEVVFKGQLPVGQSYVKNLNPDPTQCAILSSGGKDSLLSYGLLNEVGSEVHPIFINESGRHWFTALNAFRHFKSNIPNTVRVWTNADRLFSWMLRHFPFIRKDYNRLRSDEYPVRLWTVAVFLFGALPVLHKRKIKFLMVGDEYDTTRRMKYQGIQHYDGLYDQSRYFDNYLTRYYSKKGWQIRQLSVIRPLSEILIEKILAKRYPKLQKYQISCHAAHIEGELVKPCGRCEKCRRIVGMLMAMDADPKNCGYTHNQIQHTLKEITSKGIHQETAGAQQLIYMLHNKGLVDISTAKRKKLKEHPEVLKIRFDPERSPLEDIPVNFREQLLNIYREYSSGTVKRKGRLWIDDH